MVKKLRVVLDTNVIVSTILIKGKPRNIYDYALNEKFRVITLSTLLSELTGILVKSFYFL
jgi:predicted nucleic acid-binding protein